MTRLRPPGFGGQARGTRPVTRENLGGTRKGFPQTPSVDALRAAIPFVSPEGLTRLARIAAAVVVYAASVAAPIASQSEASFGVLGEASFGAPGTPQDKQDKQGKQERRVIAVGVVDEKGEQVAGLRAENFRGKYRGQPVKIISAERDAGPRRIVIVLDVSESMDGAPGKWSYAQTAFQGLIANGPEGARLALVTFDGAPEKKIGFEEWSAEAGLALGELERPRKMERGAKPLGLLGAMKAGLGLLGEERAGDVFFVITDGWRTPEEG
ncbi:MAG: VWA domain-containing protein, partial [Acidobacteria bacterium]|nr:VWA domain-containing protein [Acidobacteriota bacterium]